MLNFIAWIVVGGLLGWIASKLMRIATLVDMVINLVVGMAGAFLAALVLSPLFGTPVIAQNNFSIHAMLVALLGAVILLTLLTFFRRSAFR